MEVDLLDQGIDLLDYHRGKISTRRLALLVAELPPNSRVVTELRRRATDNHDGPLWGQQEHLLADIFDVVQHQRWLFESYLMARGGNKPPKYPDRYPRPNDAPKEEKPLEFASAEELTAFFGSL